MSLSDSVSMRALLDVVASFDDSGGASLGLAAWELCVDEELVTRAWQQAISQGLLSPAGNQGNEQFWRMNAAGWAAARSKRSDS
jgi:hypothetical protein